ncbi:MULTISPECIES: TolC family protein [Flavobacterium]|jgi:outer membrane protein TolC|uniref:Heavy metal resistance protein CzcC n=4 Tax=Flavobacterium TaxID=237 RepID=A0ABP8ZTN1_9FLAO|nr:MULTISPECIES: TolC family protein [Flavobacterium]MBN8642846.1 TolC family protein [Flavobacteriales bacterium]PJE44579.1 MAG: heavy metal resistance protein CzcC [Flavobacterium sp.] [Flavobacterium sp. FEMGT703F]MBM6499420.1 TolC family protein [Flavobacterium macrobrachii]MCW1148336.1 TolC family protein [Flavobacterium lacisediminis]HLO72724.1 TolC family protein [Flavobacterium sp.]
MLKNKYYIVISFLILSFTIANAQIVSLDNILSTIKTDNPQLKMYDADIQSMDAAAKGAKSWMAPQVETGFFMTPYNTKMWKADDMSPGMGSYMIGVSQMIPNSKKQNAEYKYMNAMSSVEKENKNYTLNQLYAIAKTNYYQWLVLNKKVKVANDNLLLLKYMIKSMEIRYQYNMDKLPTYYKAKSQYNELESMIIMLQNDISQKRIMLNTLMSRDKNMVFEIEEAFELKEYNSQLLDTSSISKNRSDINAIKRTMEVNQLKIDAEKSKFLPEFGVKYDHMFAFGQQPQQFSLMGMMTIPMPWSTKMNKANISSFQIKNESLNWQKQMILNETVGMISGMNTELSNLNKQYNISEKSIIPSLRKNYDTAVLAWQNNTGDLFIVLDAWEALNMAQMDALDKLQSILNTQVEIEKQLEIK